MSSFFTVNILRIFLFCQCNLILFCICLQVYYLLNVFLSNAFLQLQKVSILSLLSRGTLFWYTLEALFLRVYGFGRCAQREVQPVLEFMGLKDEDYWITLFIMLLQLVLCKCLTLYLLIRKIHYSKKCNNNNA